MDLGIRWNQRCQTRNPPSGSGSQSRSKASCRGASAGWLKPLARCKEWGLPNVDVVWTTGTELVLGSILRAIRRAWLIRPSCSNPPPELLAGCQRKETNDRRRLLPAWPRSPPIVWYALDKRLLDSSWEKSVAFLSCATKLLSSPSIRNQYVLNLRSTDLCWGK